MKKIIWTYAKLPRAGLGNKLLVWARAFVFSEINKCPFFVSNWADFKIGPFIRNEKSKRQYWGYFKKEDQISILRKIFFLFIKARLEPDLNYFTNLSNNINLFIFTATPDWPDYFLGLREYRNFIRIKFYSTISSKFIHRANLYAPPVIGVHVRRSDFKKNENSYLIGRQPNTQAPNSYYINIIKKLRKFEHSEVPVTIFTDGRNSDIADLLELPFVQLAPQNSDIVDLILLSRSKYIVITPGSTFSYWAAFISEAFIIKNSSKAPRIRSKAESLFEGTIAELSKQKSV